MPIVVKYEAKQFTPVSEGLHQAVCVDVVDLGMKETQWGAKQKVRIVWQVEELNDGGNRQTVIKEYTMSLNPKATLRKDLETWRGKKFSEPELQGFDLEKLLEVNAQVQVVHNLADDGRIFSNVQAIVPVGRGMTALRPNNYTRVKDRPTEQVTSPLPTHMEQAAAKLATMPPTVADMTADDVPF